MTRTTDPVSSELGFELERFEFTAADRLEVRGRWFGVRGRRFMRPTLNLRAGGRRRRLIAVLDHKPWAADTDEAWVAAFAWGGERGAITHARLEVAPDVVLELPAPGAELPGAILHPRPVRRPEPKPRPAQPAEAAPPPDAPPPADAAPPPESAPPADAPSPPVAAPSPPAAPSPELAEAERRLADERAERERVAAALHDAEARLAALGEHHDAAVDRANELVRLEGELAAAKEHIERVERDRIAAQERGEAAERALAEAGDVTGLRRRAETAERDAAAARDRAEAAELEAAALRRAEARHMAVPVPAGRRKSSRRERGWGARAIGLVWIAVLLLALVAIAQLVL